MRRTFTLQLAAGSGVDTFEAEARCLDAIAKRLDDMLGVSLGTCSIRHDRTQFSCYVGTHPDDMVRIVRPRTTNALSWEAYSTRKWCEGVISMYHRVQQHGAEWSGDPTSDGYRDGNHPPRPAEESLHPLRPSRFKPINRGT